MIIRFRCKFVGKVNQFLMQINTANLYKSVSPKNERVQPLARTAF